jgi:SAM-dependent methyltransferase
MVTLDRWQAAQSYEQSYWQSFGEQISDGRVEQMDWYQWRAEQLVEGLGRVGRDRITKGGARLIEVGCGPIGVASFFPASRRLAVDPLENFYSSNPVLTKLRNPSVEYKQGTGESLPSGDGEFDLAIIENCIDHVRDVDAVMRELRRVLKPDGVLYLTVNCRTSLGYVVHRALSRMRIDAGHPHTFTTDRVSAMFARNGFRVLGFQADSYFDALKEDLRTSGMRPRIKALLGTSEFVTTAFATPLR